MHVARAVTLRAECSNAQIACQVKLTMTATRQHRAWAVTLGSTRRLGTRIARHVQLVGLTWTATLGQSVLSATRVTTLRLACLHAHRVLAAVMTMIPIRARRVWHAWLDTFLLKRLSHARFARRDSSTMTLTQPHHVIYPAAMGWLGRCVALATTQPQVPPSVMNATQASRTRMKAPLRLASLARLGHTVISQAQHARHAPQD